jgi:uncharacterized protein (TIGR02118 family)
MMTETMKTLVVCVKRRSDLTPQQFSTYYRDNHASLIMSCPDFTRHLHSYKQHHVIDAGSEIVELFGASGDYDAVAILTFKSEKSMVQAFQEPQYLNRIRPTSWIWAIAFRSSPIRYR